MSEPIEVSEKPYDLIRTYVALRSQRTANDAKYAEHKKLHFDDPLDAIEKKLLDICNKLGTDSLKTKAGTAYKKLSISLTTADGAEFRRHIIGAEAWDLIDFRPNKTAINELVDSGEPLPPGLNRAGFYNIHINKPSKEEK